jgi:FkbM family methyltransferase
MTTPFIFFDVGANNGYSSVPVAQRYPNATVYGFEPTPQLIKIIESRIKELSNYKLIKTAVSDYNGKAVFNISGNADWGCSSLLPLSEKSKTDWYGRTDMFVTEQIEVNVIRLDTFIEQHDIQHINYLHIDTQGSDLKVLQGMGRYIHLVEEGVMEAANKDDILYVGQNTKTESIKFLEENRFTITNIQINDPAENEVNIYFKRK